MVCVPGSIGTLTPTSVLASGRPSIVTVASAGASMVTLGMRGESAASSSSASLRAACCTATSPRTSRRVTASKRSEASTQRFSLMSARADHRPNVGTFSAP
jgi:hypothetical protein